MKPPNCECPGDRVLVVNATCDKELYFTSSANPLNSDDKQKVKGVNAVRATFSKAELVNKDAHADCRDVLISEYEASCENALNRCALSRTEIME